MEAGQCKKKERSRFGCFLVLQHLWSHKERLDLFLFYFEIHHGFVPPPPKKKRLAQMLAHGINAVSSLHHKWLDSIAFRPKNVHDKQKKKLQKKVQPEPLRSARSKQTFQKKFLQAAYPSDTFQKPFSKINPAAAGSSLKHFAGMQRPPVDTKCLTTHSTLKDFFYKLIAGKQKMSSLKEMSNKAWTFS